MLNARDQYAEKRRLHWDSVALEIGVAATWGEYYHKRLEEVYRSLVFPGLRVIEIGCGHGDLLAALKPSFGVGVDFSGAMVRAAGSRHPDLHFIQADAHELPLKEKFDLVVLSDLVNDLWDVQAALLNLAPLANRNTRVIINLYSRVWELPLAATEKLGLARPTLNQNWLHVEDLSGLLELADFQVIRHWTEILCPLDIPLFAPLCNRILVKLWPFRLAALTSFMIARYVGPSSCTEKFQKSCGESRRWGAAPNSFLWRATPPIIPMGR
jgi:SAM-dependent methyltransferase